MTRINTLSLLAAKKEPPPSGVWAMTMAVLGAFCVTKSSPVSEESVRLKLGRLGR